MSPLIRKEIRLLLPFWGLAMCLAIVPVWLMSDYAFRGQFNEVVYWLFSFGILLLGLAPFGQEFGMGTFSSLLAQPFERRRIWRTKILLMTGAAVLVFLGFILSLRIRLDVNAYAGYSQNEVAAELWHAANTGLFLIAIYVSGGFWTSLLFRQTGAAFWFGILIPGVLLVAAQPLFHGFSPHAQDILAGSMLLIYSAAGFVWAYRMFVNAQDSQWLGETVALLSLSPAKPRADTAAPRRKGALRALIRKEFQSHQISLIISFGLLVLHGCTLVFRKFHDFSSDSELRFAVEAVPFLWLLVPWLIGCVSVAEERKLGIMESQLCLPVTRRLQFAVKFLLALFLGMILGGLMPCLIEGLGSSVGISSEIVATRFAPGGPTYFATIFETVLAAGFFVTVSFFASSLTRNTLQALGTAIFVGGALLVLFQWALIESTHNEYSLWKGPLIFFIGVPVAIIAVIGLSFSNYKMLHTGRSMWLRNLLVLSMTIFLAGIATAVVYQRPWESLMSLEPRHGAPRMSGPVRPTICMPGGRVFALLSDGRLWTGADYASREINQYETVWDQLGQSNRLQKIRIQFPTSGTFVGGSNWVALAANGDSPDVTALQSDGTLWKILAWEDRTNRASWFSVPPRPRRIGMDDDWKSIVAGSGYFLAIKTNGTLWGWGNNDSSRFASDSRGRISDPVQIGKDSDWAEVFPRQFNPVVMKTSGVVLEWLSQGQHLVLNRFAVNGKDWQSVAGTGNRKLVLLRDGTLRASDYLPGVIFGTHYTRGDNIGLTPVGGQSHWTQIAGLEFFAAIREDGSLVKSDTELFSSALGQPSRYSDWVALTMDSNGLAALASDGTVSLWRDTGSREWVDLAPTHRPLWSLNIFAASKN